MIALGIIVLLLGAYLVYALVHPEAFLRCLIPQKIGGIRYVAAGADNHHLI